MIPALLALVGGGLLARTVLWPLELRLERRHVGRVRGSLAALEQELDAYRRENS